MADLLIVAAMPTAQVLPLAAAPVAPNANGVDAAQPGEPVTPAADAAFGDDDLVPWKPVDQAAAWLASKHGREFKRPTLNNLMYRLRRTLRDVGGLPEELVQRSATGVRVALLRRGPGLIFGDGQADAPGSPWSPAAPGAVTPDAT
jgi:hypothetical protein